MKISVLQLTSTDNVPGNMEQLFHWLGSVPEGTDLICTPENTLFLRVSNNDHPGFCFTLEEEVFTGLKDFCAQRSTQILMGSIPVKEEGHVFNAMVLVNSSEVKVVYRKIHLFDVDVEGEKPQRESDQYKHGQQPAIIEIEGWKLGLSICYDLRFPELYLNYAKEPVDIILVPAAFLIPTGRAHWHTLLQARAIESQCYVVAPAQCGEHKGVSGKSRQTFGHSLVVDPWGRVIAEAQSDEPQSLQIQLDRSTIDKVRAQIPMSSHRHTGL